MEEKIIKLLKEVLNLQSLEYKKNLDLESIGVDSVVMVEFAVLLEDEFNIVITKDERRRLNSIEDIVKLIEEKQTGRELVNI